MTRIYLVRHGQTENNTHDGFNGCVSDQPLNKTGETMVARLTPVLAHVQLDAIYTSPLRRAVQTAEAVRGTREMELRLDPRLRETDFGRMDGMNWKEAKAKYPEACREWGRHPERFCAPGAVEGVREVSARVMSAFLQILRENRGKTVAIVAHGMVFALLTSKLVGYSVHDYRRTPMINNAAYRVLQIEDDGHLFINEWEHNAHLEDTWCFRPRRFRKRMRLERARIPRHAFYAPLKMTKKEKKQYGN